MPAPRGTSAARHNCIVSQSKAPVNTLFAEAAAFFARLSLPRRALNAAGRAAAAHPPRIVGRIPQRPRGIRGEAKPTRYYPPPISQKFRRPRRMPLDGKSPPKGKDNCQNRLSPYLQPAPRMQTRAICGRHTPCRLTAKTPAHMKHKNPRLPPSFAEQIHDIQHDNQNDDQRIKRQRGVNAPPR